MDGASGPDVSDREIVTVLAETDEPWLRAADVTDDLPIDAERLRDRLDDLHERGLVERADDLPGEQWRPAEGVDATVPESEVETDTEAQATVTGTETPAQEIETPESPPPEPQESVPGEPYRPPEDAFEAFDPPGTPEQTAQRREALRQAYAYLRERERASRDDLVSAVFPEARGAYEQPDDGWWEEVVRPGLAQLPDVESDDGDEWRYTGAGEGGD